MADDALWRIPTWFPQLAAETVTKISLYHRELLKFNPRINLISRGTEREADEIHFADALLAAPYLSRAEDRGPIYDLGSGNGVPGLIFAIVYPQASFRLVESDSRKVEFLKHVIHALRLDNVTPLQQRVETLAAGSIALAVNRGFASVDRTLEWLTRPLANSGVVLHLKGVGWVSELEDLGRARQTAWKTEPIAEYALPESGVVRTVLRSFRQ